jgi:HlyD family secretion protein
VVWENPDVLKLPNSALFRSGQNWSVFVAEAGLARQRSIEVGHRGALDAEITRGIQPGEQVVLHPSNDLKDGVRIASR